MIGFFSELLKKSLGGRCPKIVRIYGETLVNQVFPIPRDTLQATNQKGRRYELIDKEEHKDVAMHHLIRRPGKLGNRFATRILAFDKTFAANRQTPENVTDEQIDEYKKLVREASAHELLKHEVILCTCATSASWSTIPDLNVRQVIVDECGMSMEPDTLIPLVNYDTVEQVVLIGDHRQLQPIVTNAVAKDLGLQISMFERYQERAILLNKQFRMVRSMCQRIVGTPSVVHISNHANCSYLYYRQSN